MVRALGWCGEGFYGGLVEVGVVAGGLLRRAQKIIKIFRIELKRDFPKLV
jgi:hypothetical protein